VLTTGRARGLVAVGFAAMLTIAAALLFAGGGGSAELPWRAGRPVPVVLPPGVTVVDRTIPVPVAPDTTVWTGSELLTFGARGGANVGAVYEPSSGRWRAMSPSPFGAVVRGVRGVWTGRIWVLVGVSCARADADPGDRISVGCEPGSLVSAAYDPDTDIWRVIDDDPRPAATDFGPGHSSSFGSAVGVFGPDAVFQIDGEYYAFRPDHWDWQWLAPLTQSDTPGCSTGSVLARYRDGRALMLTRGARVWSASPDPAPARAVPPIGSVCTHTGLVVYAEGLDVTATYDVRAQRWDAAPSPTVPAAGAAPSAAFTGASVVWAVAPKRVVAYDVDTRAWREAAPGLAVAPDTVAWTDDGYGLYVRGRQLDAYDPGR
jgi:hypothetical protein